MSARQSTYEFLGRRILDLDSRSMESPIIAAFIRGQIEGIYPASAAEGQSLLVAISTKIRLVQQDEPSPFTQKLLAELARMQTAVGDTLPAAVGAGDPPLREHVTGRHT